MNTFFKKIKCFFGFHNWINIDNHEIPQLKENESYSWCELHECSNCKKQQYLGMGTMI